MAQLDSDRASALRMMNEIEEYHKSYLTSTAVPAVRRIARALAEDIVKGEADENDCIIRMKEQIEMVYKSLGGLIGRDKSGEE